MAYDPYNPRGGAPAAKKPRKKSAKAEALEKESAAAPDAGGSGDTPPSAENLAASELRDLIERVERVEEDQAQLSDDKKAIYAEAKARGFDTKALRRIVSIRKKDINEWREQQAVLDTYLRALGMQTSFDF